MGFRIPPALFASGGSLERTFTTDTLIGNLWTYLGSPAGQRDVELTVDGADIGDVQITLDWAAGSTFTIVCINDGRVLGLGGNGGAGGADLGATGEAGAHGVAGGAAIASAYDVSIDIDDGYLLGGGGGGGGGSYTDTGAGGDSGGGGGGGQGFSATTGGAGGTSIGSPASVAGTAGGQSAAGVGGNGGGATLASGAGGDGGIWGAGGASGRSSNIIVTGFSLYGGVGGRGGLAFSTTASDISFDGAKDEATLRSEGRIKGEIGSLTINVGNFLSTGTGDADGVNPTGIRFLSTGDSTMFISGSTIGLTSPWAEIGNLAGFGDDYEVRERGLSGDIDGSWTNSPGSAATWYALSSDRTWTITSGSTKRTASLFEFRRIDLPAGSSDDEIIASIYFFADIQP